MLLPTTASRSFFRVFSELRFHHKLREGNRCADALARYAINSRCGLTVFEKIRMNGGGKIQEKEGDDDGIIRMWEQELGLVDELEREEGINIEEEQVESNADAEELLSKQDSEWWDDPNFPEAEFKKAFRMGKATFNMICEHIKPHSARKISVRQRVAACLWRLATGDAFKDVARKFGMTKTTCQNLILEVSNDIIYVLAPRYLQWPDAQAIAIYQSQFQSISGLQGVIGSIRTSHISIVTPNSLTCNNVSDYLNKKLTHRNRKPSYSVIVQGIVDPIGAFLHVSHASPGSMSDEMVFRVSDSPVSTGALSLDLNNCLVGTSGYSLIDFVLVPLTRHNLTQQELAFNDAVQKIQKISKDAFARLKGRWRFLNKLVKSSQLLTYIDASCVLHNICELENEEMDPDLLVIDVEDDDITTQQPGYP
ncbi:protein ALP1-like [Senna tora]|uniref:Protein ALP1-like n=1 Tax=Senna tora TaxID=362788 RepID=A0A834THA1_9FABA|nr:protein ALP1-like [Senna tora]